MPKVKISEYSTTNADNTDIEGINIAEGCAPSGINNAIRELMVHLKEFQTGASGDGFTFAGGTLMTGTNTLSGTNVLSGSTTAAFAAGTVSAPSIAAHGDTNTGIFFPAADTIAFAEGGAEAMRIDSSGRVLIGTTTNQGSFTVNPNTTENVAGFFGSSNTAQTDVIIGQTGYNSIRVQNKLGNMTFATGASATERMRIDSSGNVGIGTSSPASRLNIAGSDGVGFTITQSGTTTGAADTGGVVVFQNYDGSNLRDGAYIYGRKENATVGNYASYMSFWTRANGVAAAERMRITSGGEVLVGGTTAISNVTGVLTIERAAGGLLNVYRNDTTVSSNDIFGGIQFYGNDTTSNTPTAHAYIYGTASGTHAAGDNPTDIVFGTTPDGTETVAEAARITQAGALVLKGGTTTAAAGVGIVFPATQVASANANCLDDYEEGTFTATLTPQTSGTITLNSGSNLMAYTKVGRLVSITGALIVASVSSPNGTYVDLGGLPFANSNIGEYSSRSPASFVLYDDNLASRTAYPSYVLENSSSLRLFLSASSFAADDQVYISLTYFV